MVALLSTWCDCLTVISFVITFTCTTLLRSVLGTLVLATYLGQSSCFSEATRVDTSFAPTGLPVLTSLESAFSSSVIRWHGGRICVIAIAIGSADLLIRVPHLSVMPSSHLRSQDLSVTLEVICTPLVNSLVTHTTITNIQLGFQPFA